MQTKASLSKKVLSFFLKVSAVSTQLKSNGRQFQHRSHNLKSSLLLFSAYKSRYYQCGLRFPSLLETLSQLEMR